MVGEKCNQKNSQVFSHHHHYHHQRLGLGSDQIVPSESNFCDMSVHGKKHRRKGRPAPLNLSDDVLSTSTSPSSLGEDWNEFSFSPTNLLGGGTPFGKMFSPSGLWSPSNALFSPTSSTPTGIGFGNVDQFHNTEFSTNNNELVSSPISVSRIRKEQEEAWKKVQDLQHELDVKEKEIETLRQKVYSPSSSSSSSPSSTTSHVIPSAISGNTKDEDVWNAAISAVLGQNFDGASSSSSSSSSTSPPSGLAGRNNNFVDSSPKRKRIDQSNIDLQMKRSKSVPNIPIPQQRQQQQSQIYLEKGINKQHAQTMIGRYPTTTTTTTTTTYQSNQISPVGGGTYTNRNSQQPIILKDMFAKQAGKRWTEKQDTQLRAAVAKYKGQNWKAIAEMVDGRNHVQCLQRWKKVLQPGLVKGLWAQEEDELLLGLMNKYGNEKSWTKIAEHVPGRTAKQCRERWYLNLDPTINRGPWTKHEDAILLSLHAKIGNKWAEIKRSLPGRTENGVKSRFKSIQRALQKCCSRS